jgi:cyanate permease
VTGLLYDIYGNYRLAFAIALAMSVVSAVAGWAAAPGKVRAVEGRIRTPIGAA